MLLLLRVWRWSSGRGWRCGSRGRSGRGRRPTRSRPIFLLSKDIQEPRDAIAVACFFNDIVAQARLQTRLLIDEVAQLVLGELQERAEARRRDELRTPDEAVPKQGVRPDFLGDQPRK